MNGSGFSQYFSVIKVAWASAAEGRIFSGLHLSQRLNRLIQGNIYGLGEV